MNIILVEGIFFDFFYKQNFCTNIILVNEQKLFYEHDFGGMNKKISYEHVFRRMNQIFLRT